MTRETDVDRLQAAVSDHFGPNLLARAVLAVGVLTGTSTLVSMVGLTAGDPDVLFAMNFEVYYAAAEAAYTGTELIYDAPPDGYPGDYYYLYPPIVVVAFVPFLLVPSTLAYAAFTVVSVGGGVTAGLLTVRYLRGAGVELRAIDAALIIGYWLATPHVIPTLYYGNINLLLGAGAALGFVVVEHTRQRERDRDVIAGVAFGLVALVKAFPAMLGAWLIRSRSTRGMAAWAATGTTGLLAGIVLFGRETTETYFRNVLLPRGETEAFVGGLDPGGTFYVTFKRPISHLLYRVVPDADPIWVSVGAVVIGVVVLTACYWRLETRTERLVAAFATAVVTVAMFASYGLYLVLAYFPFVALLYTLEGRPRVLFAIGGLLFPLMVRPSDVFTLLSAVPGLSIVSPLFTVVSLPLLGLLVMLTAGIWAGWGDAEGEQELGAGREERS